MSELTRRQFMGATAAAGAGMLMTGCLAQDTRPVGAAAAEIAGFPALPPAKIYKVFAGRTGDSYLTHPTEEIGRFNTQQAHLDSRKISGVEMGADALIARAAKIGEKSGEWAKAMIGERGVEGIRVLLGLIALTRKHTNKEIEEACGLALSHGAYKLRTVRQLMECRTEQEQFDFIEEHPLIRDMADYGELVPVSFT
jgi:hypothetical protein